MGAGIFATELRRALRLGRSYWLEYLANLVLYTLGFLLLMVVFRAASPEFGQAGYLSALIGYLTWKLCATVLVDIADIAGDESQTGTLEQLFLVGRPPGLVFLGRTLAIIANQGFRALVLGVGLAALLGILQPVPLPAVLVLVLTLLGAVGMGFALAGLVLVYKRLGGATHLLWQMLVFFTGALAPIYPSGLAAFARLLPLTLGIESLRAIFLDRADLMVLEQRGLLPALLAHTLIYLIVGALVFRWGERQARRAGLLAQY